MSIAGPMIQALENARLAAARLPVCDGAARLHALLARIVTAMENEASPRDDAKELVLAAADALEGDPWVQFERAARALHVAVSSKVR